MRILIIGANSAVAQAFAMQAVQEGNDIFCLMRSESEVSTLSRKLGASFVGAYCYDFTLFDRAEVAVKAAADAMGGIDLAFFAHGYLPDQLQSEIELSTVVDCLHVNFTSVVSLLIPIRHQMEQQGSGKIAVISSVAGDRGRPRNFTYAASKSAMSIYLQGLRSVLWRSGIEVYDFKMGPVDTPMTISHEKNFSFSTAENVAALMLRALKTKRYTHYVPSYWRWVMMIVKHLPEALFQRLGFLSDR